MSRWGGFGTYSTARFIARCIASDLSHVLSYAFSMTVGRLAVSAEPSHLEQKPHRQRISAPSRRLELLKRRRRSKKVSQLGARFVSPSGAITRPVTQQEREAQQNDGYRRRMRSAEMAARGIVQLRACQKLRRPKNPGRFFCCSICHAASVWRRRRTV